MPNIKPNIFDRQSLNADVFLEKYWQQRPFIFRQTNLPLETLPSRDELFGLAANEGVQSRIIFSPDQRRYQAIYDDPTAWPSVSDKNPTLLVSDIEKWCPQTLSLLDAFPFIKSWRFDDFMLSYAPKDASVGAHIDQYDVFLIQVKGQRQWSYDEQVLSDFKSVEDSELAVIDNYQAQHCDMLSPGDMLYLPPGIPHHGVSMDDDCITLSVGLRAPSAAELLVSAADHVAHSLPDTERLTDEGVLDEEKATISQHEISYLRQQLAHLQHLSDEDLSHILHQFLTGYRLLTDVPDYASTTETTLWQKNPGDRFLYRPLDNQLARLYVNGEDYACSLAFAQYLCNQLYLDAKKLNTYQSDHGLLNHLLDCQHIIGVE